MIPRLSCPVPLGPMIQRVPAVLDPHLRRFTRWFREALSSGPDAAVRAAKQSILPLRTHQLDWQLSLDKQAEAV